MNASQSISDIMEKKNWEETIKQELTKYNKEFPLKEKQKKAQEAK